MPPNEVKVVVTADTTQAQAAVGGLGGAMGGALKAGAIAAGVALLGTGAAATKMGINFQTAFAEVTTLFDAPKEQVDALRSGVRGLAREMGIDATEATKALYQAISAGVSPDNALAFLRENTKLAIGGVTDLTTAVDLTTTTLNAFGLAQSELKNVSDAMFTAVRLGKTTIGELGNSMFNIAPVAATLGSNVDEVAAALAALTAKGVPTSEATTQLRSAMLALAAPTKRQAKELADLGISIDKTTIENEGLLSVMLQIVDAAAGDDAMLRRLLGSQEAMQAVLNLTTEAGADFTKNLEAMENKAGATNEAYEKMNETFARQFALLKEKLKFVMLDIALKVLPALTKGAVVLGAVFDDVSAVFGAFAEELARNKPLAIGLAAVVGTVLVVAFAAATVAVLGFVAALLLAAAPILAVGVAIGLLAAGLVLLVQNGPEIEAFFRRWGEGMAEGAGLVREIAVGVVDFIGGLAQTMFDAGVSWMTALARGIAGAGAKVTAAVASMVASVIVSLNPLLWVFGSSMQDVYERAGKESGEALVSALEGAISRVSGITETLLEPLRAVRSFISGLQAELGRILGLPTVEGTGEQIRLNELRLDLLNKEAGAQEQIAAAEADRLKRIEDLTAEMERVQDELDNPQGLQGFNPAFEQGKLAEIAAIEAEIEAIKKEESALEREIRLINEAIEVLETSTRIRALETEALRLRGIEADNTILTDIELVSAAENMIDVIARETEGFGLSAQMITATYIPAVQAAFEETEILTGGVGDLAGGVGGLSGVVDAFSVDKFTAQLDDGIFSSQEQGAALRALGVDVDNLGIEWDATTVDIKDDWDKLKESLQLYVDSSRAGFDRTLSFLGDWKDGTIEGLRKVGNWFAWLGEKISGAFHKLTDFLSLDLSPDISLPGFLDPRNIPVPGFLPGGLHGVENVPRDMAMFLHKGERVVNAADAGAMRAAERSDDAFGRDPNEEHEHEPGGIVIHELHLHGPLREALADLGMDLR